MDAGLEKFKPGKFYWDHEEEVLVFCSESIYASAGGRGGLSELSKVRCLFNLASGDLYDHVDETCHHYHYEEVLIDLQLVGRIG